MQGELKLFAEKIFAVLERGIFNTYCLPLKRRTKEGVLIVLTSETTDAFAATESTAQDRGGGNSQARLSWRMRQSPAKAIAVVVDGEKGRFAAASRRIVGNRLMGVSVTAERNGGNASGA